MIEIDIAYEGKLKCKAVHKPSGAVLTTKAPPDTDEKWESFSPTDLAAASLGTCMLTVMAILADQKGIKIKGATANVQKHMSSVGPRRIERIAVSIVMPAGIPVDEREILEKAARSCPMHHSLGEDIKTPVHFTWS